MIVNVPVPAPEQEPVASVGVAITSNTLKDPVPSLIVPLLNWFSLEELIIVPDWVVVPVTSKFLTFILPLNIP